MSPLTEAGRRYLELLEGCLTRELFLDQDLLGDLDDQLLAGHAVRGDRLLDDLVEAGHPQLDRRDVLAVRFRELPD